MTGSPLKLDGFSGMGVNVAARTKLAEPTRVRPMAALRRVRFIIARGPRVCLIDDNESAGFDVARTLEFSGAPNSRMAFTQAYDGLIMLSVFRGLGCKSREKMTRNPRVCGRMAL